MSLAQRIERSPLLVGDTAPLAAGMVKAAMPLDFRDITRRAPAAVAPMPAPIPTHVAVVRAEPVSTLGSRKESDLAMDLLSEVSKAFPALMERCEKLDAALVETKEQARAEIDAANEVAREWQQIASALKLQVEGLEKGLKAMKARAEAAEQQVADLRESADASQHAAAEAECLSSLFQEKVISTFGAGSMLHPLLEAFRSKQAA